MQPQRAAGNTSPPCRASPSRTVTTHSPSAPRVLPKSHALQMLAAIRDAIPRGDVQRTAVTILPITVLKTCSDMQHFLQASKEESIKAVADEGQTAEQCLQWCHMLHEAEPAMIHAALPCSIDER